MNHRLKTAKIIFGLNYRLLNFRLVYHARSEKVSPGEYLPVKSFRGERGWMDNLPSCEKSAIINLLPYENLSPSQQPYTLHCLILLNSLINIHRGPKNKTQNSCP